MLFYIIGPSARSLIAYMSEASLKKGPAWGLSTTLDAGRLCERYGCGSSITLIIFYVAFQIIGKYLLFINCLISNSYTISREYDDF